MSNFMTVNEVAFVIKSSQKNHYYDQKKGTILSSKTPKAHRQKNQSTKCC